MWSILDNVPYAIEKNLYSAAYESNVICVSVYKPTDLMCQFI